MTAKKMKFCSCGKRVEFNKECSCKEKRREQQNKYKRQYYENNKDTVKLLSSTRWRKLRKLIINRDNGCCQRCLVKYGIIEDRNLQVHHILPRIYYPDLVFEETNLITLCQTCNLQLGTQEELDFEPIKKPSKTEFEFNL